MDLESFSLLNLSNQKLILKKAQEAQIKAQKEAEEEQKKVEEEQKKVEEEREKTYSTKIQPYAVSVIEKCFSNPNSNTTFEVASPSCDDELNSLQRDCQLASSPYDYCKDERFLGYLKQHNISNSTAAPSY